MSVPIVKDVNQQFNELSYTNSFSKIFYEKMLIYIGSIIR